MITDTEGDPYFGIVDAAATNDETVILLVDEGSEIVPYEFPRDEIDDMRELDTSLMPANLKEVLTIEEIYHILRFLLRLK